MTREQQQRTKIKICGLKRPEDITYVNEAKPDYCGFIIEFPKSSRNVTGALVRELTAKLNPDIIPVGVFVNAAPERVEKLLLSAVYRTYPVLLFRYKLFFYQVFPAWREHYIQLLLDWLPEVGCPENWNRFL